MRAILAVDSGGSKSEAVLVQDDGTVLGWGRCDYSHPESGRGRGGSGRDERTIARAVSQALGGVGAVDELHLVGRASLPNGSFSGTGLGSVQRHPAREQDAALALAGEEAGVVVLAGTGAFVYGRTRDGRELLLDALGPLLGDRGSGYQIGLLAVRAAARARWHPRHATSLAEVIPPACAAHLGCPDRFSLVDYMLGPRDRAEIASLAVLVNREAEAGDRVARGILEEAAAAISDTVWDVVDRLGVAGEDLALVGTGSVATQSRLYWEHLCSRVREFAPRLRPVVPDLPPVLGLALLAARELPGVEMPAFLAGLRRSVGSRTRPSGPEACAPGGA